jgi:hypothetical protein
MRAYLRLSLHVEILILDSTRVFLKTLVNHLMIVLLGLSPLSVVYVLVILLHIPIMNVLSSCLYVLDDSVWGMKIIALKEYADFAIPNTKKLFSKLKSHELSRKGRLNYDASLSSKILITSARVGGHDANPTNTTVSSALEFVLSSLVVASDEQYESIPDDEITLLVRKF